MVTTDRGDVVELLDAAGNPFIAYRYDVWGSPQGNGNAGTGMWSQSTNLISGQVASDIASRQVLRYASYCYDSESGLYYLSARSYDPITRQFLSKDEAKADGEESEYQYCKGDPVGNTDPSGETLLSNLHFLIGWAVGSAPRNITYRSGSVQVREMRNSVSVRRARKRYQQLGYPSSMPFRYNSYLAYFETAMRPWEWGNTATQVGGYDAATITNNHNGTCTYLIRNDAGTHSFFLHQVRDRQSSSGPMRTVHQTFCWNERIPLQYSGPKYSHRYYC